MTSSKSTSPSKPRHSSLIAELRDLDALRSHVELENLNRCNQFRRSDAEQHAPKADTLARWSTPTLDITGITERYTDTTATKSCRSQST